MKDNVPGKVTNNVYTGVVIDEIQQYFETNYSQSFSVANNMNNSDLDYIDNNIFLGWLFYFFIFVLLSLRCLSLIFACLSFLFLHCHCFFIGYRIELTFGFR